PQAQTPHKSTISADTTFPQTHLWPHNNTDAATSQYHRSYASMEKLTIHDTPQGLPGTGLPPPGQMPPQQNLGPAGPPAAPQLPPQMFTTAAQLLDLTDKKLMVALRDGRKLIGVLRSWDQFGNLVLQDTIERFFVQNLYADITRGLFLVRGENVSMLGEIDLDKDDYIPPPFEAAPIEKVFQLKKEEDAQRKKKEKSKHKKLAAIGFEGETGGEAIV
ncbi:small nuclear ribonucleoprotein (LSM1), partial [Teratosphaeria destructans]